MESAGFEPASKQVIKLPSTSLFIFKFSRKYLVDNNQNIFLITLSFKFYSVTIKL
nr:hypothetical protein [uncultured bacterium]